MSVTIDERTAQPVREIVFDWVSDADGTATATTRSVHNGQIVMLITDPGTPAPSASWDVTVTDSGGYDALLGAGANRHAANTLSTVKGSGNEPTLGSVASSKLTLDVSHAGDGKAGKVIVRIR